MKKILSLLFSLLFLSASSWILIPPTSGGFVPSDVPDMILGIDPTCTQTTSQWNDCWSGNSKHVIAGAVEPTTSTLNGQPVLTFGSLTSTMETATNLGLSGDAEFTLIGVWKASQTADTAGLFGCGDSNFALKNAGFVNIGAGITLVGFAGGNDLDTSVSADTSTKIAVLKKTAGAINSTGTIRLNGVDVTDSGPSSSGTPNITDSHFRINYWHSLGSIPWIGQIGAAFVFSRALTGPEITNMENYLNGLFAAY